MKRRLRQSSGQALAKENARKNWQRAYRVALKKIVLETFGAKRAVITMKQIFTELSRGNSIAKASDPKRQPILLLLGGGMAAGKTSVREIIGSDAFWSDVHISSPPPLNCSPGRQRCRRSGSRCH